MAYEIPLLDITLTSSGDMSSYQYRAVAASSANAAGGCTLVATRGAKVTGVYQDNSTASEPGRVRVWGVSKLAAGDSSAMDTAITEGLFLVASSVGQAVPSSAADLHVYAMALESLSTGSTGIIAGIVFPSRPST